MAENRHLEIHLRKLLKIAAPAATLLHVAAMAVVWDNRLYVAMLVAQALATVVFNAWASTVLVRRFGPEVTESVRAIFNVADVLLIGFETDWSLVYWLWVPYFALVQEGLTTRHHRARYGAMAGVMIVVPLLAGAQSLALGVGLCGLGLLTYLIATENARLARDMLAELEERLVELRTAQAQLVRASHRAGMAEVATGVLHNVGNVLASINVSTGVLSTLARSDSTTRLNKAMDLVREQGGPVRFLGEGTRGRTLLEYVDKLASALTRERAEIEKELAGVRHNVDHIKQIVRRQQSLAHAGGFVEPLRLDEIIADAIELTAATKGNHPVELDLAAATEVSGDRHKVAQILTNLLANAREAISGPSNERHIVVRTRADDDDRVAIVVEDTGIGIAPENMAKIFSYGFTSKPTGHGFGLHASACAAIELGGTLSVASPGVDQGATFTLVLPRYGAQPHLNAA